MADAGCSEAWEVFRQEKEGDAMRHGGASWRPTPSSPSTTPASCTAAARRASGCGSSGATDIHDLSDPDLLQPPLDRSFKKPGGYVMRDKLAAAREQQAEAEPKDHGRLD